jgi:hypothetical protein
MLQLENRSPFAANIAVLPDRAAIDTLYVILKATLTLRPKLALAPVQIPPVMADEYYEDPATSSLKRVTDMHIGKPGTDVLLVGHAYPPRGRETTETLVTVSVAGRQKAVRVTGDRVWLADGTPSAPHPYHSMPLVWERAFGGVQRLPDRVLAEERNPIGVGFAGGRREREMAGQPVPNLEDPASPLGRIGQQPVPACFAPISPAWLPRRAYAGTYDAGWQRKRAPYLPADFDPRFFQCAAPELTFDRFLQGNEPLEIHGASADGPLAFPVPAARVQVEVRIGGAVERPPAHLETLLVEPDENRLCMTWRAALPCDRRVFKVEKIVVALQRSGAGA